MGKNTKRKSMVSSRRGVMKASKRAKTAESTKLNRLTNTKSGLIAAKVSPIRSISDDDSGLGYDGCSDVSPSQSPIQSQPQILSNELKTRKLSLSSNSSNLYSIISNVSTCSSQTSPVPLVDCIPQVISMSGNNNEIIKKLRMDTINEDAQQQQPVETKRFPTASTTLQITPTVLSFRNVFLDANVSQNSAVTWSNNSTLETKPVPLITTHHKTRRSNAKLNQNYTANEPLSPKSSCGSYELRLTSQPESQHRARYQTEGSRGAVKDRSGQSFPTVSLIGYNQPTTLQVFVGRDCDPVLPHLFYQACKVSGKNSTSCKERKLSDGTAIIDIQMHTETDMTVSCDCVGILKVRNVDVEKHRGKSAISRGKKRSSKCRLVFRTVVTLKNGTQETLQVVSQPISCSQPLGVPEICRKSLSHCDVNGGEDLFILGKNFHKDPVVIFQEFDSDKNKPTWSVKVQPDKESLQSVHLVCEIPPYHNTKITEDVEVQVLVCSGDKLSEAHTFTYKPLSMKSGENKGHNFYCPVKI